MKDILTAIGTAAGLAIAGYVIQLIREQVKRIKDERLQNLADDAVNALEQAIPKAGQGASRRALSFQILQSHLGLPKEIVKDANEQVRTNHAVAIEAAVRRMKQAEGR